MSELFLEMKGISKTFPGVKALNQVDFSCRRGEVHALVGENGAGKSTMVKILAGAYHPDEGTIILSDKKLFLTSPRDAQRAGISTIYQEFNLIPELNVAENIFLGHEPIFRRGFIHESALYDRSRQILTRLEVALDLRTKVKNLSVAQQQMVEIAKALSVKADIIIMDEPSAVVSGKELDSLFRIIKSLKDQGITIIYISHRLEEIFQISDRVTVLKDGKLVGVHRTSEVDKPKLIGMMVGRSLSETFPQNESFPATRTPLLRLQNVCYRNILKDISFTVHSGEIVGVAGLVGSGRTELARAIFGAEPIGSGEISFNGAKLQKANPKRSISIGIGFVPEDRKRDGIVNGLSVMANLTLPILRRISKWFILRKDQEKQISKDCIQQFSIATPGLDTEIQYLSGGNQQKVILARWTNTDLKLLIMDEPTRGIDVGSKAEIYKLMRHLVSRGTSIIMISSELPEVIGMSDRILVMHEGQIMGELAQSEASEEKIMMLATGHRL